MKTTFDVNQLADMKKHFIEWLDTTWCTCNALRKDHPDAFDDDETYHTKPDGHPCMCYGRDEYDEIDAAIVDDDVGVVICYGDRSLNMMYDDSMIPVNDNLPLFNRPRAGELFIECDEMTWVGDDVDYYGPCLYFIEHMHKLTHNLPTN